MLKRFCQCIGLSSLILVMNYGDLLGGGGDVRLHVPWSLAMICVAQILDIALLGLAIFAVFALVERTRFYPWMLLLIAMTVPPYLVERMRDLFPFEMASGLLPLLAVLWAAVILLIFLQRPSWYRGILKLGDAVGVFLAIFAFCSIAQLAWIMRWKPGTQQYAATWTKSAQSPRQHPLLVWVVFDELSYDQVFEHRAHDLQLPAFDSLRSQSTVFTDVQPIGRRTVMVIPSLFTGHIVDDYRYSLHNRFSVHYTNVPGWHLLDGSQTVFADAQKSGWRTAAVGWYNPYCSLYTRAIDNCYWTNRDTIDGPMAQGHSLLRNTLSPLQQMAREVISSTKNADRDICSYDVRQRYQTHIDLQSHAMELLQTDQADFIFLHLSIPHSPNIWSRLNDNYTQTCGSSYLDNLALADRSLGRILGILKSSPRWNDTTLIVQGDHSWRIDLWNWMPAWTAEDEVASRQVYDPRPALLIHQAGQTQPQLHATAWSLLQVHDVVEAVLAGKLVSR
ncbi:MAG: sulfatase-like hydrolase/transferase [Granulicella sp.]